MAPSSPIRMFDGVRAVRVPERAAYREPDPHALCDREGALRQPLLEILPRDVLEAHEPVLGVELVERGDVGVVQDRHGAGFKHETLARLGLGEQLRVHELERHLAAEPGVLGAVDLAHAAGAKAAQDPILRNLASDHGDGDAGGRAQSTPSCQSPAAAGLSWRFPSKGHTTSQIATWLRSSASRGPCVAAAFLTGWPKSPGTVGKNAQSPRGPAGGAKPARAL